MYTNSKGTSKKEGKQSGHHFGEGEDNIIFKYRGEMRGKMNMHAILFCHCCKSPTLILSVACAWRVPFFSAINPLDSSALS